MADDIVQELRDWQYIIDEVQGKAAVMMLSGAVFGAAADEIEGLRELGDSLVEALQSAQRRHPCNCADGYDARIGATAINDWQEARRG